MRNRTYKDQFMPWVGFYSVLAVKPQDLATIRLMQEPWSSFAPINDSTESAAMIANEFIENMIYGDR